MFRKKTHLKIESELLTANYYCNLKAPSVFIKIIFFFYHRNSEKLDVPLSDGSNMKCSVCKMICS